MNEKVMDEYRKHHFFCIRKAIEEMDVFVFTLGLTECWADKRDGAVFPIAPGVAGGQYDPEHYEFLNFDEVETFSDLKKSLEFIRAINPAVKIILTVSPVPLNATYEDRHVLVSTVLSKSILRLVAQKAINEFDECVYFPSYEIITSPHVCGQYFAEDCREVLKEGVDHVMGLFLKHYISKESIAKKQLGVTHKQDSHSKDMGKILDMLCDEESIDHT